MTTRIQHQQDIAGEEKIVRSMLAEIGNLGRTNPEFFAHFEDTELHTASRADLVDLMALAPNDQVKFSIFGRFTARLALAGASGTALL